LTLAIMSGKGGVGKSNVAVNLSICLAELGLRVALADLDMGLANADLLMNLKPRYTLSHLVAGVRTMEEISIRGPGGIRFIPGASGTQGLANLSEFERQNLISQLHRLIANADIAVFDLGAGISRNVTSFAHSANRAWVVTTPEPTALTDAYATVKALQRERCRARVELVVNMAASRAEAQAAYRRVAGVARKFLDFPLANGGYLLQDTAVELAVQARCPFVIRYPGSNASACIAAMASEVARTCAAPPRRGGFFKRVAGLFV
jgi:flagellar biosynthesis protein FlhG